MKKVLSLNALIVLAFCIATIGNAMAGETFKLRTAKHAIKWEQIEVGDEKGHFIFAVEAKGIVSNMDGKSFGDGCALRFVGLTDFNAETGVGSGHGYEETTDKDGDKYYVKWEGKATEGGWKGTYTILKGSGKYEGIKGKGTFSAAFVGPQEWYTDEEWDIELP